MPENGDNNMIRPLARLGHDGLAQIGLNRFDIAGIRFVDGEDGANPQTGVETPDAAIGDDGPADEAQDADDAAEGSGDASQGGDEDAADDAADDGADEDASGDASAGAASEQPKVEPKPDDETPKLQVENLKLRVALRMGLDEDLADRLRGTTSEELTADAEKLLALIGGGKKLEDRTPRPKLRGGTSPEKDPELSPTEVVKLALGR